MHTLEQIKAFTPQERNEFIDGMIGTLKKNMACEFVGIYYCIYTTTDYTITPNKVYDCLKALNIPILKPVGFWFDNQTDRISFLKSIKTAE